MTRNFLLIAISIFLLLTACSENRREKAGTVTAEALMDTVRAIHLTQPERALHLLDSAEERRLLNVNDINGLRAVTYQNAYNQTRVAQYYAERIYYNPETRKDTVTLIKTLKMLSMLAYKSSQYSKGVTYANDGNLLAHSIGDKEAEAHFLEVVGSCFSGMHMQQQALAYYDESLLIQYDLIKEGKGSYSDIVYTIFEKMNIYLEEKDYDSAIALTADCENALKEMKESGEDKTVVEIRYADFYYILEICFCEKGEMAKAKEYYDKLRAMEISSIPQGKKRILPYLINSRQFALAKAHLHEVKDFFVQANDTVNSYYANEILFFQKELESAMGQHQAAMATMEVMMAVKDSIEKRERDFEATELSIMYDTQNKILLIQEQQEMLERYTIFVWIVILALLIAMVIIAIIVYYNRIIYQKNKANIATIDELMALKHEKFVDRRVSGCGILQRKQEQDFQEYEEKNSANAANTPDENTPDEDILIGNVPAPIVTMDSEVKLKKLMDIIEKDMLFRDASFNRNKAVALVPGLTLRTLSSAFSKVSGVTFPRYLNNLRLDYSLYLLKYKENLSIEGIALESGFSNRQNYYRLFSERFSITPAEYKKFKADEKENGNEEE